MFKVGLENYTVMGIHGAYDFEHKSPQPFVVSVWIELDNIEFNDDLKNTINYADIQIIIDDVIMNSKPVKLMETMMVKMIDQIKLNKLVRKIRIRIEKPEAALPNDGGLAVVESEWPFQQENSNI
tara:strand:- start:19 stop:393 length:375 start_codon:yes stop_codon:yes gene_type:complete